MDLAEDLKPVKVDAAQIEQVVVNLAVNARDAMPQGGRLSIETANTVLDRAYASSQVDVRPGEYVVITVGDTGVGMSDEVKAHLFEPFFTTKERGQGTGLGLPTVFGIVKQNGGHIEVRSEIGVGTTFEIFLPVTEQVEAPTAAPTTSAHEVTGTETILLVEDEAPVRELAVQILRAHGYRVLAAENGPRALEVSNEYRGSIQLLLTDVVMPQMNGKELAHRLQAMRRDIRVLYISGYSEDVIAHHGIVEEGAVVLAKPFTLEALTRKVRAVLDAPSTLS
jgi:CheY-like chemotaxis protein